MTAPRRHDAILRRQDDMITSGHDVVATPAVGTPYEDVVTVAYIVTCCWDIVMNWLHDGTM